MAFAVGSKVVYPSHGVAQIVRREKRVLDGKKQEYLILEVPQQGWGTSGAMTVSVPEDRAEGLGVRPAISKADATCRTAPRARKTPRASNARTNSNFRSRVRAPFTARRASEIILSTTWSTLVW